MSTAQDPLLSDAEIAEWFGVAYSTVGKWRLGQNQAAASRQGRRKPAFTAIAEQLGVELPGGPAVPRSLVRAFGKAVGYLDERGKVIPEVQELPRRWQPVRPTIDPVPDENGKPRLRLYTNHVLERYEINRTKLNMFKIRDSEFPPGQSDELGRTFWLEEQLNVWDTVLDRRRREKEAGPAPHGYDSEGRPYRHLRSPAETADGVDPSTGRAYKLLPADSYWASHRPSSLASDDDS